MDQNDPRFLTGVSSLFPLSGCRARRDPPPIGSELLIGGFFFFFHFLSESIWIYALGNVVYYQFRKTTQNNDKEMKDFNSSSDVQTAADRLQAATEVVFDGVEEVITKTNQGGLDWFEAAQWAREEGLEHDYTNYLERELRFTVGDEQFAVTVRRVRK